MISIILVLKKIYIPSLYQPTMENLGKILVVEDNYRWRDAMADFLNLKGYETIQAGDGVDALRYLDKNSPDLMITDIYMPEVGGDELIRRVRAADKTFPIIVVAALIPEIKDSNSLIYRRKPIELDELEILVKGMLAKSRATSSA